MVDRLASDAKGLCRARFSEGFAYEINENGVVKNLLRDKKGSLLIRMMHRGPFLIQI